MTRLNKTNFPRLTRALLVKTSRGGGYTLTSLYRSISATHRRAYGTKREGALVGGVKKSLMTISSSQASMPTKSEDILKKIAVCSRQLEATFLVALPIHSAPHPFIFIKKPSARAEDLSEFKAFFFASFLVFYVKQTNSHT